MEELMHPENIAWRELQEFPGTAEVKILRDEPEGGARTHHQTHATVDVKANATTRRHMECWLQHAPDTIEQRQGFAAFPAWPTLDAAGPRS
jgi:hypothetical protein